MRSVTLSRRSVALSTRQLKLRHRKWRTYEDLMDNKTLRIREEMTLSTARGTSSNTSSKQKAEVHDEVRDGGEKVKKFKPDVQQRCHCAECGKSFTRKSSLIVHQRVHTGEKLFMCTQCGKRFSLKSSMVRHLRTHISKTANKCPDCGKCFTRFSSLFQHQKVHRGDRPHRCRDLKKRFVKTSELVVHPRRRERKGRGEKSPIAPECVPIKACLECGRICRSISSFIRHQREHGVEPLLPALSVYGLPNGGSVGHKSHTVRTDGSGQSEDEHNPAARNGNGTERRVLCAECGKSFTRKSSLIVHQRVHTGEKRFVCTQCGKRFSLKSSLVRHMGTHSPKILNICPDCGKCFSRYSSLFQHQKVHRRQKSFQCRHCEKTFSGASQLAAHRRIHAATWAVGEKDSGVRERWMVGEPDSGVRERWPVGEPDSGVRERWPVGEPDSGVRERWPVGEPDSGVRERWAVGEPDSGVRERWPVGEPDSGVRDQDNDLSSPRTRSSVRETGQNGEEGKYKRLNLIDSADKADRKDRREHFLCAECGKSFTRKSSLIVHQRVHTGEKRFVCSQCGKRFGLKSSMVRHLRTHTPKTANTSPDSSRCFTRYPSLYQHQKVHRRVKPSKCDKSVSRTSQLAVQQKTKTSANGTSASRTTDAENPKNKDYGGRDTKDDKKTFVKGSRCTHIAACNGKGATSRKADEAERGEGTKVLDEREKSYHCIDCGKYFTRKSSLVVHQRVHTGEKLYMCTECGRRFAFKSSLVRHMRTHPGQPLSICSHCGIDFSRYEDLSLHIDRQHSQPLQNHDAALKMEPDEQQWLSSDADKIGVSVPLMDEPESALLDRGRRSHDNQNLPPGEPLGDCVASSCFDARERIQGDSLSIKEEILENTYTADDHLEERTDEETCTYSCSLDWGVDFDLSKALSKDNSEKMESLSEKSTLKCADNGPLGVSSWVHGSDEDNRAQCGETLQNLDI